MEFWSNGKELRTIILILRVYVFNLSPTSFELAEGAEVFLCWSDFLRLCDPCGLCER
ncbi:hypothetical protein D1BOALGB6SA_9706 [Olavius sp. associated proteobacterium Delta 1]|nr:hypothetical protein D1BOALGB6SA_9706 [Olavius sp. associated proteobacterium Delta 1]